MDWNTLLVFLHILAFVFWLGTDVGVFVLGKFAQNKSYAIEARLLLLKVAMILDMFPRLALLVSVFTGFQLAINYNLLAVSGITALTTSAFIGIWLLVVLGGLVFQNQSIGAFCKKLEKGILCIVLLTLLYLIFEFFTSAKLIQASWLCIKVIMFAVIIASMLLLEPAFMPAVIAFGELETKGSTPEIESTIMSSMNKTYFWVITIYVAVVVSALFGVWKFT